MAIFKGAGVAIVTPMKENYEVNYDKLEEIINRQIDGGTDAIVIAGTTGESATLTMEEHRDVIKAAVEFTKHRIPVVAGTGSNCTKTAIQLSQEAEEAGVEGLLIVTPYYNKATQAGLISHYSQIADSTKCPIIMYNVPSRTGCNLLPETVAELVRTKENIVGLKEATGNLAQASKTMNLTDGKIDMYSGEDGLVVPLLAIGAVGVISVWSNVAPDKVHAMCDSFFKGDLETARKLQMEGLALVDALFSEVNPIPVKKAMNLMGMEVGPLRAPLGEMGEDNAKKLAEVMKAYGLLA
ncbi:MAG: 4-hydroxy-tetrahydrodipicolinate synthase [Agathobacter sp.]